MRIKLKFQKSVSIIKEEDEIESEVEDLNEEKEQIEDSEEEK